MQDQHYLPLVSVTVITYNSSKYVLETLNSIKEQTYKNIELIVSDDCSSDNSIEICRKWIKENKERFSNTELVTTPVNTGIPANKNRAIAMCKGDWIKSIAGDDILMSNCILDNINFIKNNTSINILISNVSTFRQIKDRIFIIKENHPPIGVKMLLPNISAEQQYKFLLRQYFGNTPSLFISKNVLDKIRYDEEFPLLEDYPFALNSTKCGFKFDYLNKSTVFYRKHEKSVWSLGTKKKIFNNVYLHRRLMQLKYIYPYVSCVERIFLNLEFYRKRFLDKTGLNSNNLLGKIINFITRKLSPNYIYKKIFIYNLMKQRF